MATVVRFGQFGAEIGGDLSGFKSESYEDIASRVGQVELYKVHHSGSRYSSNDFRLQSIRPEVGIISAGVGNKHHHPH